MHHCRGEGATVLGGARPELICLLRWKDYVVNRMRFIARIIRRQPEAALCGYDPHLAVSKTTVLPLHYRASRGTVTSRECR